MDVQGGKECLDGVEWDCFRQKLGFPKPDVQLGKGIFRKNFLIFHVMKKCFQACKFALDGFGFILFVKKGNVFVQIVFGVRFRDFFELIYILLQIDPVGFQGFGIQTLPVFAVFQVISNRII